MTITKLPALALTALIFSGATAATAGGALPNDAYFAVSVHHCAPPAVVLASSAPAPAPAGDAAAVFEDVLMGTYGGDCDAFRANEILPRLYLSSEGS